MIQIQKFITDKINVDQCNQCLIDFKLAHLKIFIRKFAPLFLMRFGNQDE